MKRITLFFALLLSPLSTLALNLTYPTLPGGFKLEDATSLPALVGWLYVFFVMISGLAAFVMIIWGGVQWMTSQGNPTATGDAKDKIQKALLGLLLVLTSFLILQIINPELTKLNIPGLNPIPPEEPAPELALSVNPTSVESGGSVALTWSGTGYTNCDASSSPNSALWSGQKSPAGGTETIEPIGEPTVFKMLCVNENTEVSRDATVFVGIDTGMGPGPAPTASLTIDPASLKAGVNPEGPFTYSADGGGDFFSSLVNFIWESTNATQCSVEEPPLSVFVVGTGGNAPILDPFPPIGETDTYTLTCYASDGQSATDSLQISRPNY